MSIKTWVNRNTRLNRSNKTKLCRSFSFKGESYLNKRECWEGPSRSSTKLDIWPMEFLLCMRQVAFPYLQRCRYAYGSCATSTPKMKIGSSCNNTTAWHPMMEFLLRMRLLAFFSFKATNMHFDPVQPPH